MIVSKTPFRMSFVGGGSDMPAYYRDNLGAVLSTTIDKYMYICVNKKFDGQIRLSYSRTEEVNSYNQIQHPLVREALGMVDIHGGIEIASMADIPSAGSGLGSSSAYTVGLLNALYAYRNQFISRAEMAKRACEIEIIRCGEPIGKQDQYAAAFGGLNLIRFHSDDSVSVDPIICSPKLLGDLENSILVFYTGRTRSASKVLKNQSIAMKSQKNRLLIRRMVEIAFEMKGELESGSIENFGRFLDENWRLKSQLACDISDLEINGWYKKGLASGAHGGKILGAGNGGFLIFFAPIQHHAKIISTLSPLRNIKFGFDRSGSQIVFYQPID